MTEVVGVAGQPRAAVASQESEVGIDDIVQGSLTAESTDMPRDVPIEALLVDSPEKSCQERLTRAVPATRLSDAG